MPKRKATMGTSSASTRKPRADKGKPRKSKESKNDREVEKNLGEKFQMQDLMLGDKFRIKTDTYNFTLETLMTPEKKAGEEKAKDPYWVSTGHYGTLEGALNGFLNYQIKNVPKKLEVIVKETLKIIADAKIAIKELTKIEFTL